MKKQYHVIGACSCWGAQIRVCERGPEDLIQGKVIDRLQALGISIPEIEMLYPTIRARDENVPLDQSLPMICAFNLTLAKAVRRAVKNGSFPIVLGGDHANAIGTWNGIDGPLGLLWIDAHLDAHTPQTSPSGAYHGMPVAALLGHGDPQMTHLTRKEPVLAPQNLAYIGVRSFEKGEEALLEKLNVRIYFMDEVKKRGLKAILPEAIQHVMRGGSHLGVSLDLDVFDPVDAPGVGSPEEGGIRPSELLPLLSLFKEDRRLAALEIVEFNPERDVNHKTRDLIFQIIKRIAS